MSSKAWHDFHTMNSEAVWTTGDWIKEEIERREWTVDELSFETRISVRLLWKYISGMEPGAPNLAKIMRAFGYDVPWVIESGDSSTARERTRAVLGMSSPPKDVVHLAAS